MTVAAKTNDELQVQHVLFSVVRACDVLFSSVVMAMAVLGTWLHLVDRARLATTLALWLLPVLNIAWSRLSRHADRVAAELVRGLVCLPVAAFLYVAEDGVLDRLWIPALVMSVGVALCVGISGRGALGCLVALGYAGTLFGAALAVGGFEISSINDAVGIGLIGCVISLVSSKLGRTLGEARVQRDTAREQSARAATALDQLTERSSELTAAMANLHDEMKTRMRVEVELRHAQKLESVGRLAAGVAHEINTPVQFVSDSLQFVRAGMSELFDTIGKLERVQPVAPVPEQGDDESDLPYLIANMPKALDRALEGLGRVTTIVRSMKEFAHPDSNVMAAVDLNRAITSTLTVARNEYKYVAELETELGALPPVMCHVSALNQVVLNIVINAAHAIGDVVRGTADKGRIHVRTYRAGDEVVIAITDTGGGIPEAAREHVFDPFFTTKPVGQGTGQGLAIARSVIVDKHHGRLEFVTTLGAGTTFSIWLPIAGHAELAHAA